MPDDLLVLTGPPMAHDMGSYAPLIRAITVNLTNLNPERFSLVYGDEPSRPSHERVLVPMTGPQVIYLNKPDRVPNWLASNLHSLLMSFGQFAWAEGVKAGWPEVYDGITAIRQDVRWSLGQLQRHKAKLSREYEALERGLTLFQEMQGATFALLAMGNLVRLYGDRLPDGGHSFLREALRWILSDWGCVPALALWLDQNDGNLHTLSGMLSSAPREGLVAVRRMLRDSSRGGDKSLARMVRAISLKRVAEIDLPESMRFADSQVESVEGTLREVVHGFQMLAMRPGQLTSLLNRALVYGRP